MTFSCVIRTAFGSPLVPEVKISMNSESRSRLGVGRRRRRGLARAAPVRVVAALADRTPARSMPSSSGSSARVGDHDLAVGLADVGEQRLAAAGGVQPDRDVAAEPGGAELEGHLRGVVHQHADVRRAVVVEQVARGRARARRTRRRTRATTSASSPTSSAGAVVLGARQQRVADGRHRQAGSAASSAPIARRLLGGAAERELERLAAVK